MSALTIVRASEKVATPRWSDQEDYRRSTDKDGDGFLVFDTATIISDPLATVSVEWQTAVGPDGSVGATLESLKLTAGDDEMFIESAHLVRIVSTLCHAAAVAGVQL